MIFNFIHKFYDDSTNEYKYDPYFFKYIYFYQ